MGHGGSEAIWEFKDWSFFGEQVCALGEHLGIQDAFGVGHSICGASVLHAAGGRMKNRFRKLALLDPTVFTPFSSWFIPLFPNPLVRKAETRRSEFRDLRIVERSFRMHPLFRDWHPEAFQGYLKSAFEKYDSGYRLRLPPRLEGMIFRSYHRGQCNVFRKVNHPVLVMTAKNSDVTPPKSASLLCGKNTESRWIKHSGSHCFPMEDPDGVSKELIRFFH